MKSFVFINDGKNKSHIQVPLALLAAISTAAKEGNMAIQQEKYVILSKNPLKLVRWSDAPYGLSKEFLANPENVYDLSRKEFEPSIKFQIHWDYLDQNPSFLIVFLSTDNEFIASVQGKMEEGEKGDLNWVQVSSSFQGKGFCTQIVKFAFDLLKKHRISQVEIHNLADLIGSRCYEKAGREAGYTFKCKSPAEEKGQNFCRWYTFTSHERNVH